MWEEQFSADHRAQGIWKVFSSSVHMKMNGQPVRFHAWSLNTGTDPYYRDVPWELEPLVCVLGVPENWKKILLQPVDFRVSD